MKRVLIVIPLLLGVVLSCKSKESAPEAYDKNRFLDRGWTYYRDGKYDSAAAVFDSIINEIDPSDMEAHLGLGLSYAALGYYSQAHGEFSLIYSRYLTSLAWTLNLHVDPLYEDTIGNTYVASSNAQLVGKKGVAVNPKPGLIAVGQWRLGKIMRENNVYPSDTTDYIYLITEYTDIIIKPSGSYPRIITGDDIKGYTDGLTYVDSFMAVVGGRLQIIDTIGPVLFLSSKNTGAPSLADSVYLYSWLGDATPDTITMKVIVYRFPRTGFPDPIVWMALAADAHTYYIEGVNYNRSYSLALIAYYTRNLISSFPSRIDSLPGLSDGKEKKALAAIIAQSSFKNEMFANAISIIRAFGDPTFPTSNWTYQARTKSEIDSIAHWTRGINNIRRLQSKIFDIFFQ